jgi:hypothetical protein
MELHIELPSVLGDWLFIDDKGVTVAEVRLLVRAAAPDIVNAVNAHTEILKLLLDSRDGISWDWKMKRDKLLANLER